MQQVQGRCSGLNAQAASGSLSAGSSDRQRSEGQQRKQLLKLIEQWIQFA
jgi:hypothetical protein